LTTDVERALWRLEHIQETTSNVRRVLQGKTLDDLRSDILVRAAYERLIEIISEASRHIPAEWKAEHPDVPWQQVHGIGNILRHVYHSVEPAILWNIYENGLDALERAVNAMIETYGPIP
jgi:uncharacterized protein with HEPN domain